MSQHFVPSRGAAPVGQMQELPPMERMAILYLRAWCDGGPGKAQMIDDFRRVLGPDEGDLIYEDFNTLLRMMLRCGRCPLMRHGLNCRCFGGHESAFAHMITAAATQDRDDALLFATTLLSGGAAWHAVQLASNLGPVLLQISRSMATELPDTTQSHSRHLH
ncbi:hypothetical protein AB9K34_15580 [Sedimentitalea sp. XS_ASV28]|uniref:hypothetical protein n=1 Tax=Sedimentitalea sp. XS_ASV28 TaxID=3241296 RepID=UPI003511F683